MSPPPSDSRDRDSMLDLPLRSGDGQAELPFGTDRLREPTSEPPATPPPPRPRRPRPRRSKKRWIWIFMVALVLFGLAYWILWPTPPEPSFSADPFVLDKVRVGEVGELQTLRVSNVGERPMPIRVLSVVGEHVDEFRMEEDGCGSQILEPGGICSVQVRFSPAGIGMRQAFLELAAEMPDSPARLSVNGEGTAPVLAVDPANGGFGSQDVGTSSDPLDLVVANRGTAPLRIDRVALGGVAERDFRLTRNDCSKSTLEPGLTCVLRLVFVPRAAGVREAEVVLDSDALAPVPTVGLNGEGIWTGAAFAVEPQSVDFGQHLVGTSAARRSIQIINRQGAVLRNIRVGMAAARGFALGRDNCSGKSLGPGESCQVQVGFAPGEEGDFDALLEISQADVGRLGIELRGRGVAPRWVAEAKDLQFGDIRVEEASSGQRVELRNDGSAAARVEQVELDGSDSAGFQLVDDQCTGQEVSPGSACALQVRFEPEREGQHQVDMFFRVAAGSPPDKVVLTGKAVAPRLSLDREMVNFDRVHRTTTSQVELSLANRGTASLRLGAIAVVGDAETEFQILGGTCLNAGSLPPTQRCTVSLGFRPTVEGRSTAQLQIEHDGLSGPHEVPLSGIGLPPPIPKLVLEEAAVDFGPQPIGNRSTIQTVNVRAGGTGSLVLREFTLEGPDAGDFSIVPATCHAGPTLLPGTTCAVGLRFVPTAAGPRTARLVLRHNAGSGADRIELRGEGLGSPPG